MREYIDMDVLVFGRGKYFQSKRKSIENKYHIIGFLDNAVSGDVVECQDGLPVYSPGRLQYEMQSNHILIASVHYAEMYGQLHEMGIGDDRILFAVSETPYYFDWEEFYFYGDQKLVGRDGVIYYQVSDSAACPFFTEIKNRLNTMHSGIAETAMKKIRGKLLNGQKLNVVFFESRSQTWFFDTLYRLFKENGLFRVSVVIVPFVMSGKDVMCEILGKMKRFLRQKGIPFIAGYDEDTDEFFDPLTLKPDILLFTHNWAGHVHEYYQLFRYTDSFNYLINYGIQLMDHASELNEYANYLSKKEYLSSNDLIPLASHYRGDAALNCAALGSSKLDPYFDKKYIPMDCWKPGNDGKKRIIWAPHWTDFIYKETGPYALSSFFDLYDYMIEIANEFKKNIQIAFKPHPLLFEQVKKSWGKDRVEKYYQKWMEMENTQLVEGQYMDLFLTSDAMIFDGCSFTLEYLVTGKPAIYTQASEGNLNFNSFGKQVFEQHYHAVNLLDDIREFIQEVVIEGKDKNKDKRMQFIREHVAGMNHRTPSERIYFDILNDCEVKQ